MSIPVFSVHIYAVWIALPCFQAAGFNVSFIPFASVLATLFAGESWVGDPTNSHVATRAQPTSLRAGLATLCRIRDDDAPFLLASCKPMYNGATCRQWWRPWCHLGACWASEELDLYFDSSIRMNCRDLPHLKKEKSPGQPGVACSLGESITET